MESITSKFFDAIARAIHGLGIVTFVMLFVISSMIFYSHNMFLGVFPDSMEPWQKNIATWLMALGWEWTVLVTTCNPQYIHRSVPRIAALASTLIVLFFVEAFDFSQHPIVLAQRWFIGILGGTINAIFSQLFHKKWMDKTHADTLPDEVSRLKKEVSDRDTLLSDYAAQLNDLQSIVSDYAARLNELQATVFDRNARLKELQTAVSDRDTLLSNYAAEVKCPICGKPHKNLQSMIAHKRHCKIRHHEPVAA